MNRSKFTIAVLNVILYPIEIYRQKTCGNKRVSTHHVKGTTVKHNQTTRRHMRKELLFEPTLKNLPVKLTMIISLALLRFKSKQCFIYQCIFLHGMHETPSSSFPTHTLHIITPHSLNRFLLS